MGMDEGRTLGGGTVRVSHEQMNEMLTHFFVHPLAYTCNVDR